jgi:hypothetical protein
MNRKIGWIVAASLLGAPRAVPSASPAPSDAPAPTSEASRKESKGMNHAQGTFDVNLTPAAPDDAAAAATPGRLSIEKQFHGDLEGSSRGQMLTATTAIQGSAGYVAIEVVRGTLAGRTGTFVLQHTGTMTRGAPDLSVTVVPDSGTEGLEGISGRMSIRIAEGKHFYDFEYELPKKAGADRK